MKKIRISSICIPILALVTGPVKQVHAADLSFEFPGGTACSFDITINIDLNDNRVFKQFTDKDGQIVRMLQAGKGNKLEFVHDITEASFVVKGKGSVEHKTFNPDGTQTVSSTGHNVLIFFPTDQPPGPTTTEYVGRVVYTIDGEGNYTLQDVKGKSTDICDALLY